MARLPVAPSRLQAADSRRLRPAPPPPRAKPTAEFYGKAVWKDLMRRIIRERGRQCEDPACRTPNRGRGGRVYGDHVVELRDGGAPLDPGNVVLRCASCHGFKTHATKRSRNEQ